MPTVCLLMTSYDVGMFTSMTACIGSHKVGTSRPRAPGANIGFRGAKVSTLNVSIAYLLGALRFRSRHTSSMFKSVLASDIVKRN